MKAIWLACCACGDYGLLQREVEGRDAGAQVLRVGDLDGLVSMARAFPSRRGAAIIAAALFDAEDVRKTVARLTAEGRVSRVVVLIEALDPSDIEGLFRAGATEVIAAHSICGNGCAGEGAVDSDRRMTIEPDAFVDREPGAPRATRGPRVDDYGKAEAEHGRRPRNPLVYDDAGGPAQHAGDSPAVDMGYVHGVNLVDELDEVEGFAGCGELSLMQHEQIAQNEPASQTEQAAMPAWTHVWLRRRRRGRCHRRPPRRLRCRRQTLPLRRIELRSSAPFRVRAVAASRRSLPPWHTHRRCWACVPPCSTWT